MKKDPTSRLRHADAQDQHAAEAQSTHHQAEVHQHSAQAPAMEFDEVDDMIRFDAAQVTPPERIAVRLSESLAHSPPRKLSWWERLLSRRTRD